MIDGIPLEEYETAALESILNSIPRGALTQKRINGKLYTYRQWTENGKVHSVYVRLGDVPKAIQDQQLREKIVKELDGRKKSHHLGVELEHDVFVDEKLNFLVKGYERARDKLLEKRLEEPLKLVMEFLKDGDDRVLAVIGLQGVGKSTLLLNAASKLTPTALRRTAYIRVDSYESGEALLKKVERLRQLGYRFLLIDDADCAVDFWRSAPFYVDVFAKMGMRIVASFRQVFSADISVDCFFKGKADVVVLNGKAPRPDSDMYSLLIDSSRTLNELVAGVEKFGFPPRVFRMAINCAHNGLVSEWPYNDKVPRSVLLKLFELLKRYYQ